MAEFAPPSINSSAVAELRRSGFTIVTQWRHSVRSTSPVESQFCETSSSW
ncbi:MAG: hypothetical protein NTY38_27940 [Acidobacteria bacterium]|nr:hypothetical protein [Acidobacteriota bacterium]